MDVTTIYHGTSQKAALNILRKGIKIPLTGGYFGNAFYCAEEEALSRSNYAFSSGVVLKLNVKPNRLLDLRNSEDYQKYSDFISGVKLGIADPDIHRKAVHHGIDGIFDNSMGGFAIYNPKILSIAEYPQELECPVPDFIVEKSGNLFFLPDSPESQHFFDEKTVKQITDSIFIAESSYHLRIYATDANGAISSSLLCIKKPKAFLISAVSHQETLDEVHLLYRWLMIFQKNIEIHPDIVSYFSSNFSI